MPSKDVALSTLSNVPRPIRRKRDKDSTKKALLDAAVLVFSEVGYESTTTREISKRAKISEALIQRYYDGKKGLFLEVMHRWMEEKEKDRLAAMPLAGDLKSDLEQVSIFLFRHHQTQADLIKIVMARAMIETELAKALGKASAEQDLPLFIERLRHFQKKNEISPDINLEQLGHAFLGANFSLAFLAVELFGFDREMANNAAKQLCKVMADGLTKR